MDCKEIINIIDNDTSYLHNNPSVREHLQYCTQCKNYFLLVNYCVQFADEVFDICDLTPKFNAEALADEISLKNKAPITIPLWAKVITAAASLFIGLLLGNFVVHSYANLYMTQKTALQTDAEPTYMAQTTETMYRDIFMENQTQNLYP